MKNLTGTYNNLLTVSKSKVDISRLEAVKITD